MKQYTIVRKREKLDWPTIPVLEINEVAWKKPAEGIEAKAQLCYDDENLYVKLSAKEKNILAMRTEPLDFPNYDSCLEFFFSPIEGDNRYFNIEVNPNCLIFQGFGHNAQDLIRLIPLNPNLSPKVERKKDSWFVTFSVSRKYISLFFPQFKFESGGTMRANFYKCGDECITPHYYSWNPMTIEKPNFHWTPDFGKLILK